MFKRIKRFFRNLSILRKFCISIFFIFFLASTTISLLIITKQKALLKQEINNNHIVLVKNLARDSIDALVFMDPLILDELIRTVANTPGCLYVGIIDGNNRIVAHTNRKHLGKDISDLKLHLPKDVNFTKASYWLDEKDGVRNIFVPIKIGYETIGMAHAGFSMEMIENVVDDSVKDIKNYILIVTTILMFFAIGGAFYFARLITTPIRNLKSSMEILQGGRLDIEIKNEQEIMCKDLLNCKLYDCPAHGKTRCWDIEGTLCCDKDTITDIAKPQSCKNCIVYRYACGDEIGELLEAFNQMVKRLRESLLQLEQSNIEKNRLEKLSALGEMAMTVAHEIKNPLNAISGSVAYLKENFQGKVLQEFLTIIETETKRLNEIVTTFMSFSRPAPINPHMADINKCILETIDLIKHEARASEVDLKIELDKDIKELKFDYNQFKQALLNILVNAFDATKSGDSITITSTENNGVVIVSVKDTGTGMTDDVKNSIFKPFFTTKTRGTGLGLASVERIIKDHKGNIEVYTELGKGTEFRIILPAWRG
ncbi:MAG: ATP-binding protein [Thermodesulfovibrionales bacterium]|nr:ATP-binding protein [Thermodesulfovibrionales bacterium]